MPPPKLTKVNQLPPPSPKGRRGSIPASIVRAAQESPGAYIQVTESDPKAAERLYKSMVQYRARHQDLKIGLRKSGQTFYVWIEDGPSGA